MPFGTVLCFQLRKKARERVIFRLHDALFSGSLSCEGDASANVYSSKATPPPANSSIASHIGLSGMRIQYPLLCATGSRSGGVSDFLCKGVKPMNVYRNSAVWILCVSIVSLCHGQGCPPGDWEGCESPECWSSMPDETCCKWVADPACYFVCVAFCGMIDGPVSCNEISCTCQAGAPGWCPQYKSTKAIDVFTFEPSILSTKCYRKQRTYQCNRYACTGDEDGNCLYQLPECVEGDWIGVIMGTDWVATAGGCGAPLPP